MSIEIIITQGENEKKLGEVLLHRGVSRRLITRLKRTENGITKNGELIRTIDLVFCGDKIVLSETDQKLLEPNGELNVEILYEDDQLIIFNKPPFMPVHPSIKHQGDTLGNFFAYHCPNLTFRPVNRLDRDTSGCVIVAKNQYSAKALQKSYDKIYYAICEGVFEQSEGTISAPIGREDKSIIKRCIDPNGQKAVTHYKVLNQNSKYALVKFVLENGRTHQIRVHMAYTGHPIAGDDLYGGSRENFKRQALHCGKVSFLHPITNEKLTVIAQSDIFEKYCDIVADD